MQITRKSKVLAQAPKQTHFFAEAAVFFWINQTAIEMIKINMVFRLYQPKYCLPSNRRG